jgi:hypothetical protein
VAITSEEEKKNCCVDGPIIALDNIKMGLGEIRWGSVHCTDLAQDIY